MPNDTLQGTAATPKTITIYALFGSFKIEGSDFVIKYASSFASPSRTPYSDLLEELRPVRDRLDPSHLNDLGSLLQRDLNDARVAQELIPYLRGQRSPIGFFPAILAVLVPEGYLEERTGGATSEDYPNAERVDDLHTKYGDCWETEKYRLGEQVVPLGKISINPTETEIIVLDGQHRGTAFRFLSGHFDPTDEIYQTFYDGVQCPSTFDADLPVTLIWFESDQDVTIDPKLISRQLFVDVNNTAKPVSKARTLLLDDRAVTAVATQSVYNFAAKRGFAPDHFSLLHGAYDKDSDLAAGKQQSLSVTEPEIVEDAMEWALFGSDRYEELGTWRVQRRREQTNQDRFLAIFESMEGIERGGDEDDSPTFYFESPERAREFRAEVEEKYLPVMTKLFDDLALLRPHFDACKRLSEWVEEEADTTEREVWRRVFRGGEGLYWTFQRVEETRRSAKYLQAIRSIETKFRKWRAEEFGATVEEVDRVYDGFVTKAFQSGYAMAVDALARIGIGDGDHKVAAERLIERLNGYTNNRWRGIFGEVKALLLPTGATPKLWPTYRDILLRMYDNDKELEVFDSEKLTSLPEWKGLSYLIKERAKAITEIEQQRPSSTRKDSLISDLIDNMKAAFDPAGLQVEWLDSQEMRAEADQLFDRIVDGELEKIKKARKDAGG